MKQKNVIAGGQGFAQIILIVIIVFALLIVAALVLGGKTTKNKKINPTASPVASISVTSLPTSDPSLIVGWKIYSNSAFGFEIKYPKEFSYLDNGAADTADPATTSGTLSTGLKLLDKFTFTDSNKNQFTLNIYPVSSDSTKNTSIDNIVAGVCGLADAQTILTSKFEQTGGISYKKVAQVDKKGRNIADFCFFNPLGNPIVLRSFSSSTEIAMKLMLSTLKFTQ